ncbi:phosphatase PAP2 family protein [Paraburkholderia domus]|uniref:phosphatase PAP2 family protein n=1 Tax=Paraburkholderia domus TaxID=2793075 RepID=UPI001914D4C7|nr:phosphatase PAP2 family protein [Paraburkholderia domus]MBK5060175.1 phosphatase PAP2 family protein [Burkholderia sp. R-70199]CAE6773847.1 Putative undecaprenyl-diphosphatase YbjG [Paraburkholderia domus]CAE6857270.1 Putative undecaprenyl-diphosphatase YbjG [Paraburkholderia domus]
MNTLEAFNQALFLMINATPSTSAWQIDMACSIAVYVIYLVPLSLIAIWLFGDEHQREVAVRAFCVTLLALGLSQIIGLVWPHPRPFVIGIGRTFLEHVPDPSFPSDHGTIFASIALTLLMGGLRRYGVAILLSGLAVAWSRVFVGVHFPLDMLGAVAVAALAFLLIAPLWRWRGTMLTRGLVTVYRKLLAWPIGRGWLSS